MNILGHCMLYNLKLHTFKIQIISNIYNKLWFKCVNLNYARFAQHNIYTRNLKRQTYLLYIGNAYEYVIVCECSTAVSLRSNVYGLFLYINYILPISTLYIYCPRDRIFNNKNTMRIERKRFRANFDPFHMPDER